MINNMKNKKKFQIYGWKSQNHCAKTQKHKNMKTLLNIWNCFCVSLFHCFRVFVFFARDKSKIRETAAVLCERLRRGRETAAVLCERLRRGVLRRGGKKQIFKLFNQGLHLVNQGLHLGSTALAGLWSRRGKKGIKGIWLKSGATVAVSVLIIFTVVRAGTLTPPTGTPEANFYTLSEIYDFIADNTAATEAGHDFTFSDILTGTGRTLTEIYSALASLISADQVKLGTTYLNVAGTLTPDGGDAGVADLFNSKTAHLTNDCTLDTGTLNLACNTASFNGTGNLVPTAYDGNEGGNNRWCIKETGDAIAGEILSGKKAWVDGIEITGSLATQTLSAGSETVAAGNYAATTLSAVDADLASANIKSGITIFGFAGNTNVVDTSSGNAIAADIFNSKLSYVDGLELTGTLNLACDTVTFDGAGNLVAADYDGGGDGSNRWCITDIGDAVNSDILLGKIAWIDGVATTGTAVIYSYGDDSADNVLTVATGAGNWDASSLTINTVKKDIAFATSSVGVLTPDGGIAAVADLFKGTTAHLTADWTLDTGVLTLACATSTFDGVQNLVTDAYDGGGDGSNRWCVTDTGDAAAGNIASGTIAWVDGVEITGTFDPWTNQWLQTLDDWEGGGGTAGEYTGEEAEWTTVDTFSGYDLINFSANGGTLDLYSGAVKRDERTGLWWSDIAAIDGGGTASTTSNDFTWQGIGVRPINGDAIGFCDALNTADFAGYDDWYLPTQKELMQAYIDGSANNLDRPGYLFWSSTEHYSAADYAWRVALGYGFTYYTTKVSLYSVRCVRR